ncbi:hypothetical protein [Seonamhaeicola marinus]|uniref:Uncharacterized protein n=1 Tax=Seonamhaeicola marinus TaxID=1912246 RepID=A0A5D0HVI1_9FLAO|nr:hypothetical protein [Seonamhaeicola marinus]TYA74840.1 hypothetical protein FUA24_16170 [Seonamhaeicola marinus]
MKRKNKHRNKIEKNIASIFKNDSNAEINDLTISTNEPLVKQQIILLAKLCESTPLNTSLISSGGKIVIEFW